MFGRAVRSPRPAGESSSQLPEATLRGLLARGDQVTVAVVDLTECIARMAGATHETADAAASISAATGTVADEAQAVASATEEMTAAMREVSQAASAATSAVEDASRAAHAVRGAVDSLAESTGQIDGVVKTVSSISDQTRLLALNATIEAARAGAAGKGFAVVAEEVKSLADETTAATGEIGDKLAQLAANSEEVREAVLRIDEMLRRVEESQTSIAAAIEEQNATIVEITRSATKVADATAGLRTDVSSCVAATDRARDSLDRSRAQMDVMEQATTAQQKAVVAMAPDVAVHPLRAAVTAHAAWKKRLRTAIDAGRLPEGVTVDSASRDNVCPFGKWLYSGDAETLDANRASSVRAAHADFHSAAGRILAEAVAGHRATADEMMCDTAGYAGIAMRLTDALTSWADDVERS
ncbi:MAG: methyl-accepting chemotaxis protein [Austwickia sp.]|nr:methyl-accepting chemotaxis protein [Actinomycetota bacterium]MCB1251793.1 CZB domain-containing protein [Austwickia sp.]MCO5308266.1 methyl-accepting chemotaxis protein [Austwickia sp.]